MTDPNCSECPLQGRPKVYGQCSTAPRLTILGGGPGVVEEVEGEPFKGMFGRVLDSCLRYYHIDREHDCQLTNVALCRPAPGKTLLREQWQKVRECCWPRLKAELEYGGTSCILALGSQALRMTTGKHKLDSWVGAVMPSNFGPVVPAPLAVLRNPAELPCLKIWVGRAWQVARGVFPKWEWPEIIMEPDHTMWRALNHIDRSADVIGFDIENVGDPLTAHIRCVGVASKDIAVSVPIESLNPAEPLVSKLQDVLSNPRIIKCAHNSQHDRLALEQLGWEVNGPFFDTLLAHAVYAPQLPHGLSYVCATETTAPRWKSEFREVKEDKGAEFWERVGHEHLLPYNAKDCIMGGPVLYPIMTRRVGMTHRGNELYDTYADLNEIAIRMRRRGILVDEEALAAHEKPLVAGMDKLRKAFHATVGSDWTMGKVGTTVSLRRLFFDELGNQPLEYSEETGEPSLNAYTLKEFTQVTGLTGELSTIVLAYRKMGKLLTTYVYGMPVHPDGCVHPTWKVYGTITGRWSSQTPNNQNVPKEMRDIFVARPGKVIVSADFSQLEMRIVALLSGDEKMAELYNSDVDVHALNGSILFSEWDDVDDKGRKGLRALAKNSFYAYAYGGTAETAWKQALAKDQRARLPMYVRMFEMLKKEYPQIVEWQQAQLRMTNDLGYVEEPMSGRREYFHAGIMDPNKTLNFPIQGGAGTLMNAAIIDVDKQLEWDAGDAILSQVHDEINIEIDEDEVKNRSKMLRHCMEREIEMAGQTVKFPVDVSIGKNWRELEDV